MTSLMRRFQKTVTAGNEVQTSIISKNIEPPHADCHRFERASYGMQRSRAIAGFIRFDFSIRTAFEPNQENANI
jgi:hypothetical protein